MDNILETELDTDPDTPSRVSANISCIQIRGRIEEHDRQIWGH